MSFLGYPSLSLIMWATLALYVVICGLLFFFISHNQNKKLSFSLAAGSLVLVHAVILLVLGFNDSAASSKKIGLETWVCGRQIELAKSSPASRLFSKDGTYLAERHLIVHSEQEIVEVGSGLSRTKLEGSAVGFKLPISRVSEVKISSENSFAWLKDSLAYDNGAGVQLNVEDGKITCPNGEVGQWNIFAASVDNVKKTYSWQKVALSELKTLKMRASDGGELPDCLVLDYSKAKTTPEFRCSYLLKQDFERCPKSDKSECEYRELTSKQLGGSN